MERMKNGQVAGIRKVKNGYVISLVNEYGNFTGESEIYSNFFDVIAEVARMCGEDSFANTLVETTAVSKSLEEFFGKVIQPKLLALEGKINPGVQNVVENNDDDFLAN